MLEQDVKNILFPEAIFAFINLLLFVLPESELFSTVFIFPSQTGTCIASSHSILIYYHIRRICSSCLIRTRICTAKQCNHKVQSQMTTLFNNGIQQSLLLSLRITVIKQGPHMTVTCNFLLTSHNFCWEVQVHVGLGEVLL